MLEAKFKAFKFPDTNYVLFRGTINVCLDSCKGVEKEYQISKNVSQFSSHFWFQIQCSTGQLGYGRRRRDLRNGHMNYDYEIHTAAILQVASRNSTNGSMLKDRESAILGSTYQPQSTINAKHTQTEQFAVSKLTEEPVQESSGSNSITGIISWVFISLILQRIFPNY